MMRIFIILSLLCSFKISSYSQSYLLTNVAGQPKAGHSGDGGLAVNALLYNPVAVFITPSGNIYISDWYNSRLRMINSSGIISTMAGNGVFGYSGDGGLASQAELNGPMGIYVDKHGNIYLADIGNQRIRKIDVNGIITTIAGTGELGFSGDGGPALQAKFADPAGICGDRFGNLFVADEFNNRIRKIDSNGFITTVAGDALRGYSGDGGIATQAELYYPSGVAVDTAGNLFIADEDNNCIRKVDKQGIIHTIAGNGIAGFSGDGGPAYLSELYDPAAITIDAKGIIYITDGFNNRIRKIDTNGIISTIAGNGKTGYSGAGDSAILATLYDPLSIATDGSGNIYFASEFNNDIQKLSPYPPDLSPPAITIYPNPNRGIFNVKIENFMPFLKLEIYNILSQKILQITPNAATTEVNLSNCSGGIYLYRLSLNTDKVYGEGKIVVY